MAVPESATFFRLVGLGLERTIAVVTGLDTRQRREDALRVRVLVDLVKGVKEAIVHELDFFEVEMHKVFVVVIGKDLNIHPFQRQVLVHMVTVRLGGGRAFLPMPATKLGFIVRGALLDTRRHGSEKGKDGEKRELHGKYVRSWNRL